MGKKVIRQQASSKISKKDHSKHQQQQQFNSLIKNLRPKVYITDSSSFKKLVQDLTGNGSSSITPSSTSPPLPLELPQVHDYHHQVQSSVEPSVSAEVPTTSSDEFCYYNNTLLMNEEDDFNQFCNNQIMSLEENDTVFGDILACDYDQINYLESLLFDEHVEEPIPFHAQVEQQISIYDYDFSGLIN